MGHGIGGLIFNKSGCLNHGVNFVEDEQIIQCGLVLRYIFFIINQQKIIISMKRKGTKIFILQTSHGNNLEYAMWIPQC
jgi:hypothetical protein